MAAKKGPTFAMSNEHRVKIQNSNILNALIEHATGVREMSSSQVTAGLGLLRKVLPDLNTTTLQGDEEGGPLKVTFKTVYAGIRDTAGSTPLPSAIASSVGIGGEEAGD